MPHAACVCNALSSHHITYVVPRDSALIQRRLGKVATNGAAESYMFGTMLHVLYLVEGKRDSNERYGPSC